MARLKDIFRGWGPGDPPDSIGAFCVRQHCECHTTNMCNAFAFA